MLMTTLILVLAACVTAQIGTSSHVAYGFDTRESLKEMEITIVWESMGNGNVYFAMQFWFECGQGGYFGVQIHSDGKHIYNYAIWDIDSSHVTSYGADPWCGRFGGEGTGSHCQKDTHFKFGQEYVVKVFYDRSNSTGDFWKCTATEPGGNVINIGSLWLKNSPRAYGNLKASSVTFQEYYTGGSFYSALGFIGPRSGKSITAVKATTSGVDAHHGISASIPGYPSGRPYVFYEAGLNVSTTPTGKNLWNGADNIDMSWAVDPKFQPRHIANIVSQN